MTRQRVAYALTMGIGALLLMSVSGCVDEKIVYRDGPNYAAPPAAAASFLGYADTTNKITVCGNCHVSKQAKWKETRHANAFKTLESSGSMQGLCQACHTVNDRGNVTTDTTAGWRSTKDGRYHDVQCESCHGPGLQHVESPTRGQMLATVRADTGSSVTNGCSECHSGTHHPFVEEWRKSRHATSYTRAYNSLTSTPTAPEVPGGPRFECQGCHIGQRVLDGWGVNTNYADKTAATTATAVGVACAVCHDPHGGPNTHQLRFPIESRDLENNLCMKCHYRRANPDFSGSRDTPHSPQGPMLIGEAGWWPPGVQADPDLIATHGSAKNPKLCATCHLHRYDVTDKATGKFVQTVTGHRFLAIPCVDSNGLPTDDQSCAMTGRSFKGCVASGCHDTEGRARTLIATAESDIGLLANALQVMLNDPKVPAADKTARAATTYRGSNFNRNLALSPGSEVHNPFLAKALLRASIAQMAKDYGITPPIALPLLAPYDKLIPSKGNN